MKACGFNFVIYITFYDIIIDMLDYLVTSKTRRNLLKLLWLDSVSGTASELAHKSGVAFAGAYKELKAMSESGLATLEWCNGKNVYTANRSHPMANLLRKLLKYEDNEKKDDLEANVKLREHLGSQDSSRKR